MLYEIIQTFLSPIHHLGEMIAGSDPTAKGIFSVAVFGTLVALGRRLPFLLWYKIKKQLVTTVSFVWDTSVHKGPHKKIFIEVSNFIAERTDNRNLEIIENPKRSFKDKEGLSPPSMVIGTGNSRGWFWYKGKFITYVKSEKTTQGSPEGGGTVIKTISITAFTRDKNFFFPMFEAYQHLFKPSKNRYFYEVTNGKFNSPSWSSVGTIEKAPHLFINKEIRLKIEENIQAFLREREWYLERGLSHKLNIVLYGPPGTGKTSLTRFIADSLDKSICSLNAANISSSNFRNLIEGSKNLNAIVSIQDFDNCSGFLSRDNGPKPLTADDGGTILNSFPSPGMPPQYATSLDLTTILNTFQGDIPLDGIITVLTTNHIEKIDSAFLRPGRTDLLIEVKPLSIEEIQPFYQHYYETQEDLDERFQDLHIPGSYLMAYFVESPKDKEQFKQKLLDFKN